ncbi:MAG TPA: class I SAM-dependent methyltransferase [Bryobacteraceae bacterium]|nr:class I SAM-dependent methyltransferase [Bryobacteraceae bacterium]
MPDAQQDKARIEELSEIVRAVRERVRERYPQSANGAAGEAPSVMLANLTPLVEARDAAQAKIAAIGSVNPRRGGIVNSLIQAVKKTIARALAWFVRDQVVFNREMVAALEATIEALNEHNRALAAVAALGREAASMRDIFQNSVAWRNEMEHRLATNEVQFLRGLADIQGAFQHRATQMESNYREMVKAQHADYLGALDRTTAGIHKQLWRDFEKVRGEYGKLIHDELRIIRMRTPRETAPAPPAPAPAVPETSMDVPGLDYTRFAYRFRGSEEEIRRNQEFYKPYFAGCHDVLDIGCGRGEFLETMREIGVNARGIDLGVESVEYCRGKGLRVDEADLFTFLAQEPEGAFDGIFSSQVVEHLAPGKLPGMIRLCASRLRRGGVLAIETPNPDCLAIFATYFYLDPTHTRPVPHALLEFYLQEAGMGEIEVRQLSPAADSIPELQELPERFRERFFGGLDYAIVARKL